MQRDTTTLRIQKARTALLLDHPFFGALLYRLKGQESTSFSTMATDGKTLFYNPEFVDTLSAATLAGVLAHEVMHPALQHHLRRGGRDPKRWNEACDYAINPLLLGDGLLLPASALVDARFAGMSAEQIYNMLESEEEGSQSNGENRSGTVDEPQTDVPVTRGGFGQVLDSSTAGTSPEQAQEQAWEWKIAVEQAKTVARQAGHLPGGMARVLEAAAEAQVNWREILRRLWSQSAPADYSWSRPNRRHLWARLYLPGVVHEGVGEIAIAVDCSGSISDRVLALFEVEVRSILEEQRPKTTHVIYFDAAVQQVDTYQSGETITLTPKGGGGTEFGPCFDWLRAHGIRPNTCVVLTDLCGEFPHEAPDYPVLWASTLRTRAPFGQTIPLQQA